MASVALASVPNCWSVSDPKLFQTLINRQTNRKQRLQLASLKCSHFVSFDFIKRNCRTEMGKRDENKMPYASEKCVPLWSTNLSEDERENVFLQNLVDGDDGIGLFNLCPKSVTVSWLGHEKRKCWCTHELHSTRQVKETDANWNAFEVISWKWRHSW